MFTVSVRPRRGTALRAATATIEVVGVLALGHLWAGGALPSPLWLALMAAAVFAAGLLVLHGRVRPLVAVPALVVAQLLLHAWLTALTPEPSGMAHAGHTHAVLDPAMVAVHVAGALVTALVWELRARAVDLVIGWTRPVLLPVPLLRQLPAPVPSPAALVGRFLVSAAPRRGPPSPLAPA